MQGLKGLKEASIFLFNLFGITLMINAPNLLVGYGLVVPAMVVSLLYTRPLFGATLFLIAHIIGSLILIYTGSVFTIVAILSLVMRSLILYIIAYFIERGYVRGFTSIALGIVVLDTLISFSLGLLYYARDAIEVGLDIYSILFIPFIYLSYKWFRRGYRLGSMAPLIYMILYYFSASYFYAMALNIVVIVFLAIIYLVRDAERFKQVFILSLIILFGASYISTPYILYNLEVALYPYRYESWIGTQWLQRDVGQYCLEGNVFISTYDPARLRILDTCVEVEGVVVTEITKGEDGDIFFDVKLDPEYEHMLSIGSWILRRGAIHVEIVPDDQDIVIVPEKGDRVRLVGVWVVDTDHGSFSEIHPTWYIEILE